ncbi:DUF551 domain-containing protein [Yersinia intermedia]|uniref:DUF551 domain-containing protein n=1 Tax=Yersinia intermedia TaxID=631 RepID=UPI0005EA5E70|nr:DUF551 domain-containing protein [Yersinia intermedia]CNH96363.1 Protein of uncharacterised function (DUF551) [Yersinia intermedia]
MKALDSFTVERLEEFIRQPLESGLTRSEQMELAQIALAAKRAEPEWYVVITSVGVWQARYKTRSEAENHIKPWHKDYWIKELYTTPQLNSPEIPDGWKLVPIIAYPSQWAAGQKAHNNAGINKVDAVYKAMVAAAPDASGFDPSLPGAEATVITHYYTPDGYKLVPTEITKAMRDAWNSAPNNHEDDDVNMCNAYRAMIAAAPEPQNQQQNIPEIIPQGWIKCSDHRPARGTDVQVYCSDTREQFVAFHIGNGEFQYAQHEDTSIACRPSHWMPLPAAPEKENG